MWNRRSRLLSAGSALVLMIGTLGLIPASVSANVEVAVTTRISLASDGTQGNDFSYSGSVSADGSKVVFTSQATNLVAGDTNAASDVFLFDVASGVTTRVSVASGGVQANDGSTGGAVSDDGSTVVFRSDATDLVPGDTNGAADVFLFDVASGVTSRVSVASGGAQANGSSEAASVSADGSTVVYLSVASNLVAGDTNGAADVFLFDVASGVTRRVSVSTGGAQADSSSRSPAVSGDGSKVAYASFASNLVPGDTNGIRDVFLFDVVSGVTTRVSVSSGGTQSNDVSDWPALSGDGSIVAFSSNASNLVLGDTNTHEDVFVFDVASGGTSCVSVASDGTQSNSYSYAPAVSTDGSTVVYTSYASNLVAVDTNGVFDVFRFNLMSGVTSRVSVASGGAEADGFSYAASVSSDGLLVAYSSNGTNLVASDTNASQDAFLTRINRSPEAAGFSATVPEDIAVGTTIGTVSGTDLDADPLTYAISAGNAEGLFAIDSTSGVVTIAKSLDYETATSHTLTVIVADGSSYDSATVAITVTDVNETEPPAPSDPFVDDDSSVFESDIGWMAAEGITKGCNPPTNDRFCPESAVTRGQMAAFLVRALNLTGRLIDPFGDDDGSIFEADIEKLAAAGITKGCNPPANDRFCPNSYVTRDQMAAFLVRALGFDDDGGGDVFTDDDGSVFEADIDRLATAGVTKGCNPPANTRFCPNGNVTRGQMAAFLHRALG